MQRTPTRSWRRWAILLVTLVVATSGPVPAARAVAPTPPRLLSLTSSPSQIAVPGLLSVQVVVSTDVPLTRAVVSYREPSGRIRPISLALPSGSGEVTATGSIAVKDGSEDGRWVVNHVYLSSAAGEVYVCGSVLGSWCTETRELANEVEVSGSTFDPDAPLVTSLSVAAGTHTPGATVPGALGVQDVHPVTRVSLWFRNPALEARGHTLSLSSQDAAQLAAGSFSTVVPASAYDGTYQLYQVNVTDSVGNSAMYFPSGKVSPTTSGTTGPLQHTLDMSAVTFEVSGSTRDVSPPLLVSVSADPATTQVGTETVVRYRTSDATGPLLQPRFCYEAPGGQEQCVQPSYDPAQPSGTPMPLEGSLPGVVTGSVGTYRLSRVVLVDSARNPVEYRRDGTTFNSLTGRTGTHAVDLSTADIRVLPRALSTWSRARPQSAEVRWSADERDAGSITAVRITVTSGGRTVKTVRSTSPTGRLVVTGLRNLTSYRVAVTPESAAGDGPAAASTVVPLLSSNLIGPGDVTADRRDDLFAYLPATDTMRLYRATGSPAFRSVRTVESGGMDIRNRVHPGGRAYGYASFIVVDQLGTLESHMVAADGTATGAVVQGRGWGGMRFLDGSTDLSGDGRADLVAVTASGTVYLYRGNGYGRFGRGTVLATGWGAMQQVFTTGDVTGDRKPDVMAIDSAGVLWIYPGNGRGGWAGARRRVGAGWGGLGAVIAARDVTRDRRADLVSVTMDGTLRVHPGRANGTFGPVVVVGRGWGAYL